MKDIIMKIFIFVLFFCLVSLLSAAQWEWAKGYGSSGLDRVWDLAIDNDGNVLVTGEFIDTLQIQDQVLIGWGLNDIFVAKFSPNGNLMWARIFGGADGDIGLGIDADDEGNSYTTGYFAATAHFGDETVNSSGSWDVFVLKLDADGNKEWIKTEGGPSNDIGYGIATTPSGVSTLTGWFGGIITFHDGSTLTSYGSSDILTMAFDSNGNINWKHQAGTSGVEYGYKVDTDYYGNTYVTGSAGTGSDFDGILAPGDGMFIASYAPGGQIRWVNSGTGAGVNSIAADSAPSVIEQFGCVTGRITGTGFFDSIILSSYNGTDDAYNAVFEQLTGHWISGDISSGPGSNKGRACTYYQYPYYAGSFEGTPDMFGFQPVSFGGSDSYVNGHLNTGPAWLLTAGGLNNDVITDIGVDSNGIVYVCGWYSGLASFGTYLINSGNDFDLDMFIAKIDPNATSNNDATNQSAIPLIKCYPNPFSENVNIKLMQSSYYPVEISIYNIKGQNVWSQDLNRPDTSIIWDGKSSNGRLCSPGIYFIKYQNAMHDTDIKSIVLMK
jgi:hypothetical protein